MHKKRIYGYSKVKKGNSKSFQIQHVFCYPHNFCVSVTTKHTDSLTVIEGDTLPRFLRSFQFSCSFSFPMIHMPEQ